ncbi:hypothetical protein, partial [Corynebacterium parakroppenstedtii]|uniref:hypothetical protein n=1 Tax=Corynebacterium parakroppenstedtii TaxID=2828363 RepID=UPI001C8D411B
MASAVGVDVDNTGVAGGIAVGAVLEDIGGVVAEWVVPSAVGEVPRVLFLGVCLDFYYCLRRVLVPKFGFHFSWRAVAQALVKP